MNNYSLVFCKNSKRGISLIAVLMFMMAATTASIVIFRNINLENFSSGARLKQSEANLAAESGIEAVQAWFSNKGADVGAMVKSYFEQSGNKEPIDLSDILGIIRPDNKQNFKVYLMGIDTSYKNTHLKFKILSVGKARDNSEVKLTAFFDVGGLYKINVPSSVRQNTPAELPGYFGGSMNFQGSKQFSSATVNGNWTGNPSYVEKDFVVTGNFTNSGSGIEIGGTMCVGGHYNPNNSNVKVGDAYFGSGDNFVGTYENVYCDGNLQTFQGQRVNINGNFTLNGALTLRLNDFKINGNLVLGDFGDSAYITGIANNGKFIVCNSVWSNNVSGVRGITNLNNLNDSYGYRFNLNGAYNECTSSATGIFLAFKDAISYTGSNSAKANYQTQPSGEFFYSPLTINNTPTNDNKPEDARAVKDYCDDIWQPTTSGCDGSKYIINDPIASALEDIEKFLAENKNDAITVNGFKCVSDDTKQVGANGSVTGGTLASILNNCYELVSNNYKDKLYNGYLIVKLNQGNDYSNSIQLDGKFILIYPSQKGNLFLSPTTTNSIVMLFLKEGATGEVKSNQCSPAGTKYNYFIYSLGDIGSFNNWSSSCPFTGNIYFPSGSCAGIQNINNNFRLEENPGLTQDLMEAGILCNRVSGSGDCTEDEIEETKSSYYSIDYKTEANWLAVSSRLKVSLASKNISREKEPTTDENKLQSSVLVMPRVVRLTTDAFKDMSSISDPLSKFYTFMYLNGASPVTTAPNRTCSPVRGSQDLSLNLQTTGTLTEGVFICNFSNNEYSDFYVIVKGETGGPTVRLSDQSTIPTIPANITGDETHRQMKVIVSENLSEFNLTLRVYKLGSGWRIIQPTVNNCEISPNDIGYFISCNGEFGSGSIIFDVYSDNIDDQRVNFSIEQASDGIIIGYPSESFINRDIPKMTINRDPMDDVTPCPNRYKGDNWLTLECSTGPTETKTPNYEWECPYVGNQSATFKIINNFTQGCEIPEEVLTRNSVIREVASATLGESVRFKLDLAWKSYDVKVEEGELYFSTEDGDVPENEKQGYSGSNNTFKAYHGAVYTTTTSSLPKQANCDSSLNCSSNPMYFTANSTVGTVTPTGNGIIKLSDISAPIVTCNINQSSVQNGTTPNENFIDVSSIGCDSPIITYNAINLQTSDTTKAWSSSPINLSAGHYIIYVDVTCVELSQTTSVDCNGTLNVTENGLENAQTCLTNSEQYSCIGNWNASYTVGTSVPQPTVCCKGEESASNPVFTDDNAGSKIDSWQFYKLNYSSIAVYMTGITCNGNIISGLHIPCGSFEIETTRISGAYSGATLTNNEDNTSSNIIVPANANVKDVCFDVNTTAPSNSEKFAIVCLARTYPAQAVDFTMSIGGKCYNSYNGNANDFEVRGIFELPSQVKTGDPIVVKDICVSTSRQITSDDAVLECKLVDGNYISAPSPQSCAR